jgi:hypothetical protein
VVLFYRVYTVREESLQRSRIIRYEGIPEVLGDWEQLRCSLGVWWCFSAVAKHRDICDICEWLRYHSDDFQNSLIKFWAWKVDCYNGNDSQIPALYLMHTGQRAFQLALAEKCHLKFCDRAKIRRQRRVRVVVGWRQIWFRFFKWGALFISTLRHKFRNWCLAR